MYSLPYENKFKNFNLNMQLNTFTKTPVCGAYEKIHSLALLALKRVQPSFEQELSLTLSNSPDCMLRLLTSEWWVWVTEFLEARLFIWK